MAPYGTHVLTVRHRPWAAGDMATRKTSRREKSWEMQHLDGLARFLVQRWNFSWEQERQMYWVYFLLGPHDTCDYAQTPDDTVHKYAGMVEDAEVPSHANCESIWPPDYVPEGDRWTDPEEEWDD